MYYLESRVQTQTCFIIGTISLGRTWCMSLPLWLYVYNCWSCHTVYIMLLRRWCEGSICSNFHGIIILFFASQVNHDLHCAYFFSIFSILFCPPAPQLPTSFPISLCMSPCCLFVLSPCICFCAAGFSFCLSPQNVWSGHFSTVSFFFPPRHSCFVFPVNW